MILKLKTTIFLLFLTVPAFAAATNLLSKDIGEYEPFDTIGTANYPKVKISTGADGTATPVSAANPLPTTGVVSGTTGNGTVSILRNVYSSTNVTTGAYVQLIASTADTINLIQVADTSGQTLKIAVGAAASEVDKFIIPPGGSGSIPLLIPSGSRVSIKALSATANVGELDLTFLK